MPPALHRLTCVLAALSSTLLALRDTPSPNDFIFPPSLDSALTQLNNPLRIIVPELKLQVQNPILVGMQAGPGRQMRDALGLTARVTASADATQRVLKREMDIKQGTKYLVAVSHWSTCCAVFHGLLTGKECTAGAMKGCSRVCREYCAVLAQIFGIQSLTTVYI